MGTLAFFWRAFTGLVHAGGTMAPTIKGNQNDSATPVTTPIVIEMVRNGNPVGKPTPNGQGTLHILSNDRVW
jgi:hypothetical protein